MKELEYPFDAGQILRRKMKLKKELQSTLPENTIKKKIAILGGSTTSEIKDMLELFLLNIGIIPIFYESEYNMYYEEGAFENPRLKEFAPDFIYIHTTSRNIMQWPEVSDTLENVKAMAEGVLARFTALWQNLEREYHCPIIQNNFELPYYRILGNQDVVYPFGRVNYVSRINMLFSEYAFEHEDFFIHDIHYEAASIGLDKWVDVVYWNMYKYGMCREAIPFTAYNIALIIKSILGKNKKALSLDLDNTLWGGIIGDDGAENIEIGHENAVAECYTEFQDYIKMHKNIGVVLTVNSKNNEETAREGFRRPDSVLREEDFVSFKANWEPKNLNLMEVANEINLLPESFVFVDDNPVERYLVRQTINGVAVPEIGEVETYIRTLDKSGYFEVTALSADDKKRNEMYIANTMRAKAQASYGNYEEYLCSLEMKAEIKAFSPMYMARIAQLTNKSNQFNLTTKRFTQAQIEEFAASKTYMTFYGKLVDKFGDNGVVSVVLGKVTGDVLDLELWLMSCRVLRRNMEFAMMDEVVAYCQKAGVKTIYGYYYPTQKNAMVKDFYEIQGFELVSEDEEGNSKWKLDVVCDYKLKNNVIIVNESKEA